MNVELELHIKSLRKQFSSLAFLIIEDNYQIIDNLYDLPDNIVDSAKLIGDMEAEDFLEFFVTTQNHQYLKSLIGQVIMGSFSLQDWGKFPYIIPEFKFIEIFTKSYREHYWFMRDDFTNIFTPKYSDWVRGSIIVGCPLMIDKFGDYRSIKIPNTNNYFYTNDITNINNSPKSRIIAYRRWIAQRTASYLTISMLIDKFISLESLHYIAPISTWTEDAKIAVSGLLREKNEIGWKEGEIPGFVGPDDFYS